MSRLRIADTALFVATGQLSNSRPQAVRRFARRTVVLPKQVYGELTIDDPDIAAPPVDAATAEGWATVAAPLEFSEPVVSQAMDGVRRYIANADDRPADEGEQADAVLAVLAGHHLSAGTVTSASGRVPGGSVGTLRTATDSAHTLVATAETYQWIHDTVSGKPDATVGDESTPWLNCPSCLNDRPISD